MNSEKKEILVVTGSRAEYGLLKSTIDEIRKSKILSLRLLVTGMHTLKKHGYTIEEIREDGVPIDCVVKIGPKDDMLTALSKEIVGIKKYCKKKKPDLILLLGDRDEPLAGAIVGAHMGIPVAHLHGGDVSGSSNVDGVLRHAITKLSNLHFAASARSREAILEMNEEKSRVFNVGAPGLDSLKTRKYASKKDLAERMSLDPDRKWIMVIQHPAPLDATPVGNQIRATLQALDAIGGEIIIIHPNSDTGSAEILKAINRKVKRKKYHSYKNLDRDTYLNILKCGDVLVGNSSSGIIEAGHFKLPVVNIGNRQSGRECGENVIHVDYDKNRILSAIKTALSNQFKEKCGETKKIYGNGTASKKIIRIIENYLNQKTTKHGEKKI
ncbi:MAG: UDP-N-acetylglucosamine 2-epimerase (hydrolyzing) [bacterium]|nr:UDP-N-acetylglucosamine 2-epimerase (hydrolyzing) [bacterium]